MLQSISESLFGSSSPNTKGAVPNNVNMSPRAGKRTGSKSKLDISEDSKLIEALKNELKIRDAAIQALSAKVDRLEDDKRLKELESGVKQRRQRPVATVSHLINDNGRQKVRMGTRGSILTQNILEAMSEPGKSPAQHIAEKFLLAFQDPVKYIQYLQSQQFAQDLVTVCRAVTETLEQQPRCVFLQSPVYVFGDIHGNLEDLHFFADNLWKLGMDLSAGHFLFLGDYVDRGMSCLECVAYLFGLKLLYPHKITLLRGNHETRDVNGWEAHYQEKSFLYQCKDR
ncbi:hypothetical protein EON63_07195 [archaeon]|nr:MAG: hypothetical protein EON63_07195 [archaeon]